MGFFIGYVRDNFLSTPPTKKSKQYSRRFALGASNVCLVHGRKPDVLRPGILGMRASNSYGHTTTAGHKYRVHPPHKKSGRERQLSSSSEKLQKLDGAPQSQRARRCSVLRQSGHPHKNYSTPPHDCNTLLLNIPMGGAGCVFGGVLSLCMAVAA